MIADQNAAHFYKQFLQLAFFSHLCMTWLKTWGDAKYNVTTTAQIRNIASARTPTRGRKSPSHNTMVTWFESLV